MRTFLGLIAAICLPLRQLEVTSGFGYRTHPLTGHHTFHNGVDLRARHDTIFAIMDGLVIHKGSHPLIGLNICVDHGDFCSVYGHLSQVFVTSQDSVFAGQPIGITGATGSVTGEHLHFAIRCGHHYLNPLQFLYALLIKKEHEQEF